METGNENDCRTNSFKILILLFKVVLKRVATNHSFFFDNLKFFRLIIFRRLLKIFFQFRQGEQAFLAPIFWTTDMELTGAIIRAFSIDLPIASAATKVEEKASPAPVRSYGGSGSGYGGINQASCPS